MPTAWLRKSAVVGVRIVISTLLVCAVFVLTQDFLIFPGLYSSKLFNRQIGNPPAGVDALSARAADGHEVSIWRVRAEGERRAVAVLFHGNAEDLPRFVGIQTWLGILGISSYSVEYRGYDGWKSGWPSEEGFYLDADVALKLLQREEKVGAEKIIVLGSSIGTGVAAQLAQKNNLGTLVLLAPYTSLADLASQLPVFGFLTPFLKFRFPTRERIPLLTTTCVILAHGRKDSTIPFAHSQALEKLYRGSGTLTFIVSDEAGHADLMRSVHEQIAAALDACLARK